MATITKGIPGTAKLAEIIQRISEQEARNCEFVENEIKYQDQKVINAITFKLYDDDTVPKPLTLKKHSDPPPAGSSMVWQGVVAVENQLLVVDAYRQL